MGKKHGINGAIKVMLFDVIGHEFWASCDPYDDQCNEGDVPDNKENKCYWICMNDDNRLDVAKELNNDSDHENDGNSIDNEPGMRFTQQENTYHQGYTGEDLGNFRDERSELILDIVEDHLNDEWFTCTINDDDLDCIVDYLELQLHDGFVNI
ncbi:hypothetical protein Tco_0664914 [Tanacetum coccineum]